MMPQDHTPKIFFLKVTDNATKLLRIASVVQDHFYSGEHVLISVPSDEAAAYVDALLWKTPEDSFLPHVIAEGPVNDRIVISKIAANVNQAKVLINLIPSVSLHAKECQVVYDLLDLTHPAKEELSKKRMQDYQALGWKIEII